MGLRRKKHGVAALKHCYCQPISMLLHKKRRSKRIEKPIIPYNKLIHTALQNRLIFPIFTQAGMLFTNTPKVKRCLSRKRTIEILLWAWAFCAAFTLQSFDFSVESHGLIQTHSASATYRFRLELCQGQEIVHNLFY